MNEYGLWYVINGAERRRGWPQRDSSGGTLGARGTIAIIGDSLTYQDGNGESNLRSQLVAAGWRNEDIYFWAVIGKRIASADTNGKTTVQNIADARAQLGKVDTWLIALGTNGRVDPDATTDSNMSTVLSAIGTGEKVVWVGIGVMNATEPDTLRRNGRMKLACGARPNTYFMDWNGYIHNGRDETGLWNVNDGLHMTPAGYTVRRGYYLETLTDDANLAGWGLPVWRDEFTAATVDTTKWRVRNNDYLSYDWATIDASAATIVDNALRIRTSEHATPQDRGGRTRYWSTGYLDTSTTFTQQYGRWEMRAKLPTTKGDSRGVWPAFWLRNDSVGEIDIMESWGDPTVRTRAASITETSSFAIHESTNKDPGTDTYNFNHDHQADPNHDYYTSTYSSAQDYHTWAAELTPTFLKTYFDGKLTGHFTPTGELVKGVQRDFSWIWGPTFSSAPWHIRLNTQMGDSYWSPDITPSNLSVMPADFIIQYVRVWEYKA